MIDRKKEIRANTLALYYIQHIYIYILDIYMGILFLKDYMNVYNNIRNDSRDIRKKKNYPIDIFPSLQQNKFDRWTDFNEVEVLFKTRYIYKIYSMYKLYIYRTWGEFEIMI